MTSLEEFKDDKKFMERVNAQIPLLWESFDYIRSCENHRFTDNSIDNIINSVFQKCIDIINYIPLMASVINIPQVVRGRPNYNNEIFSKQSDISYNSECRNRIEFGRFNQKGEPLFYASLPTEKKTIDYVLSCALECCKELTFGNNNSQDITIGGWTINQPFPVLNLCFDTAHLHENATLAKEMQKYIDTIDECFSFEAAKFIKNFLYYFSELSGSAASSDYHYFSTTALFHAIRYYYYDIVKEPKFGLIYPGAMSEKKGLNIVLTCDAVNRFLSLDKVVMYRYYLLSGTKTYIAAPCSDIAYPKNGEFLIQNYRRAIY